MATYYATAVWFEDVNQENISHVFLHIMMNNTVYLGTKFSKNDVIKLLSQNEIYTAEWDYKTSSWHQGSKISIVHGTSKSFLRSDADKTVKDNLGHLLHGWVFGI